MAVYGQLTGKPTDDPSSSPPGLPDTTPEDKGTRDGTVERSIDGRSQVSGTFASARKEFRQVEGSQDQHMKWSPPSNYGKPASSPTPHFTAATSPTRARDFDWYIKTNSNIVGRRTLCKPGSRNAVGEIIFILLSSESEPLEMLFCGAFIPDYLRILGTKKSAWLQWLLLKVRTYVFAELARNSNIPKITTPQG